MENSITHSFQCHKLIKFFLIQKLVYNDQDKFDAFFHVKSWIIH